MYFGSHYHSAIVLAGASEQLLAGYVIKHGDTPEWKRARSSITKIANGLRKLRRDISNHVSEKKIGDIMNRVYNNSKHAGKSGNTLLFDPKFEAQQVIERALNNFDKLFIYIQYDLAELPLAKKFHQELDGEVAVG